LGAKSDSEHTENQAYLPDFCAAGTVFIIVLVAELIAIMLTLAGHDTPGMFMIELAKTSLFVLWLGLLGAVIMCVFRDQLESAGKTQAFVISFVVLLILCFALAEIAYQITRIFGESAIINDTHAGFLKRTVGVSAIIIALSMRYLYISSEWRRSIVLEAQARISALQALIRPHFLFNSMNTIASLTHDQPDLAEQAIENLSDLFRASLAAEASISLQQELELTRSYIALEALRLGDRLEINWQLPTQEPSLNLPALTLQPLVENAIYHGIEPLSKGGSIDILIEPGESSIEISISNPVVPKQQERQREGNRMALENIRERLDLSFSGAAAMELKESETRYTVKLMIPMTGTA
jgi:two-component system sensor histidine kinase AlgZ